jgi:L-fuculose-phosphate aldolase
MFYKNEFVDILKILYQKNLIGGYGGNVSIRENDKILITPSQVNKGLLKIEDLVIVDIDGVIIDGKRKPSSEILMHLEIYKNRDDVKAIIHSHPPYSVAICISETDFLNGILPETTIYLGRIGFVKYIKPGTIELAKSVSESLREGDATFMENHGVVVVGKNIVDALSKIEILEEISKSFIYSKILGKIKKLPDEDIKYFLELYKSLRKSSI